LTSEALTKRFDDLGGLRTRSTFTATTKRRLAFRLRPPDISQDLLSVTKTRRLLAARLQIETARLGVLSWPI